MYSIQDKVMHPTEGACYIEDIITMSVDNSKKEFYKLVPLLNEKACVYIPVSGQITKRIRKALTEEELTSLLEQLSAHENVWIADCKARLYAGNNALKSGDFLEISSLIKMMLSQENEKPLGSKDREFLNKAQKIVFSEIAIVKNRSYENVLEEMKHIFS